MSDEESAASQETKEDASEAPEEEDASDRAIPARSNATGVSRNSLTVLSPPHDNAPPSNGNIFATPMYNTLEPPPRGAKNVCRSCADGRCCR